MKVYIDNGLPVKSWCMNPEDGAIQQAYNISRLPFAFKHIALMPDTHQGYGVPIGSVLAAMGNIIPNAVGVDIGCGMLSIKTSIKHYDLNKDVLKRIMGDIRKIVPVGFKHQEHKQDAKLMPHYDGESEIIYDEYDSALKQLGTLGGGNHFIEVQRGDDDFVYIMIHSGSRNLGKKVCDYYHKIANAVNKQYFSSVDPKWDLAFLPLDSQDGIDYKKDMQFCVDFALANRTLMANNIKLTFIDNVPDIYFGEEINIAHNYARIREPFWKECYDSS